MKNKPRVYFERDFECRRLSISLYDMYPTNAKARAPKTLYVSLTFETKMITIAVRNPTRRATNQSGFPEFSSVFLGNAIPF